ncbi:unnamed protein product [Ectocarpus sp. CCAP 1310/34]|nr:unnamed protein product [Ectocarpus sp. CCAP 1310/34]
MCAILTLKTTGDSSTSRVWYCCNTITTQPKDKLVAAHTNESRGIATTTVPWRRNTGGKSGKCPGRSCGLDHTQRAATMSEGASAGPADASQASQSSQASAGGPSSADQGAAAADPKATGEDIDEMLAANDPVKNSNGKRVYPEPNFPIERWSDQRECNGWISGSWKLRPNNGSIVQQRPCILVLDDFKCHKDEGFIAALKRDANTIVTFIPGGLTPLLQPLDRMLYRQMMRLLRGKCTAYSASAVADARSGKMKPPERGIVSTWCKEAWESITPETVKTCFKISALTLALDGSEGHAWCEHNFGEDCRDLLEEQHAVWLAEHLDVTLPPLKLLKEPGGWTPTPCSYMSFTWKGKTFYLLY